MSKTWGESFRTTTVCIDSYKSGVLSGHYFDPASQRHQVFSSATQFLVQMENMLDCMELPKSFSAKRSFRFLSETDTGPPGTVSPEGKIATFAIRILFRQNASWQGSITWLEGRREESFRSVLELLLLMDNALNAEQVS